MNTTLFIWLATDNALRVRGLADQVTGEFINDAEITATLYDAADVAVPEASDLAIGHIADSDGDYAGEIPSDVALTEGAAYYALVTIIGNGFKTTYKLERTAAYKTA